jgi:hypothetical protein
VNAARLQALKTLVREHKLFSAALAVGAFLRLLTVLGYPGALWFAGDSYVYVGAALRPQPNLSKSTGYSLFLRALLPFHSFTLNVAAAVRIVIEVAVYALHTEIDVNRIEMNGLLEFLRIVGRNDVVAVVEQVALAVALVDGAEIPAVTVIVGELGVLELRIELADLGAELGICPFSAHHCPLGVAIERRAHFITGRVFHAH